MPRNLLQGGVVRAYIRPFVFLQGAHKGIFSLSLLKFFIRKDLMDERLTTKFDVLGSHSYGVRGGIRVTQ